MSDSGQVHEGKDLEVKPGDRVTLRKPHPCGSTEWQVTRIGADIGLQCLGCNRVVMLPRHVFRARLRHIASG